MAWSITGLMAAHATHSEHANRLERRHWIVFAALAATGLAADQASKAGIRASLPVGQVRPALGPLFLRHAENPGIALGALPAGSVVPALITLVIAGLAAIFVTWGRLHSLFRLGCALAIAGCVGNLLDRLLHGRVTDFLAFGALPVFNVADGLIVSGFLLLLGATAQVDLRE